MTGTAVAARAGTGARRWWALGAVMLAVLAVGLDLTVLSVALPTLAGALRASEADLQWFSSGYALVLAAAMLSAGLLGDRYERKKVMLGAPSASRLRVSALWRFGSTTERADLGTALNCAREARQTPVPDSAGDESSLRQDKDGSFRLPVRARVRAAQGRIVGAARGRFEGSAAQVFLRRLGALDFATSIVLSGASPLPSCRSSSC